MWPCPVRLLRPSLCLIGDAYGPERDHLLIPVRQLRRFWRLQPLVILHVGAHEGEEMEDYAQAGWGMTRTAWVEANPEKVRQFSAQLPEGERQVHCLLEGLAWDINADDVPFFVASNSQASSGLTMTGHLLEYPGIRVDQEILVKARRLETLIPEGFPPIDFVNLDVQGSELRVLKGLGSRIDDVSAIYSEVNVKELYSGCALLEELDRWLLDRGFVRVDWELTKAGWGDALYLRADALPKARALRRFARLARQFPRKQFLRIPYAARRVRSRFRRSYAFP